MRSRKPDTRATISTCRELSVCATKVATYGMGVGATVITDTTGGGRCGAAASLEQPATSSAHTPRIAQRPTAYPPLASNPGHCCIKSAAFARTFTRAECCASAAGAIGLWSNAPAIPEDG